MQTADIRLIAMDMDGTLLDSSQQITPFTARTLREVRKQGVKLAICSGRSPGDLALFALENELEDCALLSLNGTYCFESPLAAPFCNHVLDESLLNDTLAVIQEAKMSFACYAQNRVVIFPQEGETEEHFWVSHSGGLLAPEVSYHEKGLSHVREIGVNKIIALAKTQADWEQVHKRLLGLERLDVSSSWPLNFELMPLPYGKGTAVAELAARLGLNASQVMACGDYDNDIGMIEWAKYGVAMANATERVRNAAAFLTRSNDEDGVAHAILRHFALYT